MKVVTLARRPIRAGNVAANVLEYGTGAINIDATRIASTGDHMRFSEIRRREIPAGDERSGASLGMFRPDYVFTPTNHKGGRWPANIILEHNPSCQHNGEKRVTSTSGILKEHYRKHVPMGENGIYGHMRTIDTPMVGYVSPDGTEVVDNWNCSPDCVVSDFDQESGARKSTLSGTSTHLGSTATPPSKFRPDQGSYMPQGPLYGDVGGASRFFKQVGHECPITDIDEQSGILTSRIPSPSNTKRDDRWFIYNEGFGGMSNSDNKYDDSGGASRYFKQVSVNGVAVSSIPQALLDYLYTMITPTHVGGESLIALDLNAVDWASIPDEAYHGIIALGEPTPEQVDHMWRVVKPGAHVMLIAPDHCPTGHVGACALEDKGFEIRDAILWVREAGRVHYVPKTNSTERNLGCEALAIKRSGTPVYELTEQALADEDILTSIQEALVDAGVSDDVIDAMAEQGLPKNLIPKAYKRSFKKVEKSGRYGNSHPTVKAKAIMARCLEGIPEGALVLDPFTGSGSTALACLESGHDFIGIDREYDYLEIAVTRAHYWSRAHSGWTDVTIESDVPLFEGSSADALDGGLFDIFGVD